MKFICDHCYQKFSKLSEADMHELHYPGHLTWPIADLLWRQ